MSKADTRLKAWRTVSDSVSELGDMLREADGEVVRYRRNADAYWVEFLRMEAHAVRAERIANEAIELLHRHVAATFQCRGAVKLEGSSAAADVQVKATSSGAGRSSGYYVMRPDGSWWKEVGEFLGSWCSFGGAYPHIDPHTQVRAAVYRSLQKGPVAEIVAMDDFWDWACVYVPTPATPHQRLVGLPDPVRAGIGFLGDVTYFPGQEPEESCS